jgi:hypothetical protein
MTGPAVTPDAQVSAGDKRFKAKLDGLRERMRGLGFSYDEIAVEMGRRYRLRPRQAYRLARGWSLEQAAARFSALSPMATVHAHGLSVSLGYASGRLVIEISGLDTDDAEPEPGAGLSLVTSPGPPRQYGGRA